MKLTHKFVEHIPDELANGVLYISMQFGTVVHKCACGCGEEVVTPLGPAEWQLTFNGRTISLEPSIGNWSFPCRSHYYIEDSDVQWARGFSADEVILVRGKARKRRKSYFSPGDGMPSGIKSKDILREEQTEEKEFGLWRLISRKLKIMFRRKNRQK